MRRAAFLVVALLPLVLTAANEPPVGDDKPVAYRGARILPADGPPIDNGVLVVQRGKIVAVGPVTARPCPATPRSWT